MLLNLKPFLIIIDTHKVINKGKQVEELIKLFYSTISPTATKLTIPAEVFNSLILIQIIMYLGSLLSSR